MHRTLRITLPSLLLGCLVLTCARAQEVGELQRFGEQGRLYSVEEGPDEKWELYLLSKQQYRTEDSSGASGDIRLVITYAGGGYEIKAMQYVARCFAPFDNMWSVTVREPHEEEAEPVEIDAQATVTPASKNSHNLFWAVCRNQFRKFK